MVHIQNTQGAKVGTLGRQNERHSSYVRLAHTSKFGLCFMLVCQIKSNYYSLIYSSLSTIQTWFPKKRNSFAMKWLIVSLCGYTDIIWKENFKISLQLM